MFEILGQLVVIVLAGDLIAGFFHWLEDTYCMRGYLFAVCDRNIEHHRSPTHMGRKHSFLERNKSTAALFVIGILLLWALDLLVWQAIATVFVASCGNEIHYINHRRLDELNPLQRFLADSGLIQSRVQHNRHHRAPYDRLYCVIVSFNNEVLERIRFWRGLEAAIRIASFGQVVPQRGKATRNGF